MNWSNIFYYDKTSPSYLRWACNITLAGLHGSTIYKVRIGDVAGCLQKSNHRYKVKYQQKAYMVHRIIYELHNGEIAHGLVIDHKDGDGTNNAIDNLRMVQQVYNARNSKRSSRNITGEAGVARILVGGRYDYFTAYHQSLEGKMIQKYFSISKLGEDVAFQSAVKFRKDGIVLLNSQGASYTERHGGVE